MRSFQIYRQANPDQKKRIDYLENRTTRIQDEVAEAEAKYDYWRKSLMEAANALKNVEDQLCEYLEKLEKEMTR
jgi:septation ring formation regulator EzrA